MYNIVLSVVCTVELGTRVSDADTPTDLPDVTAAAAHDHNYFCQSDRSAVMVMLASSCNRICH